MCSYEEVERFGFSVPNELAAGIEGHSLRINSKNCVFTTVNRSAQLIGFNFLDHVGTQDATFDVLWLEVTLFDEELHLL
jgi:hypothetical protein